MFDSPQPISKTTMTIWTSTGTLAVAKVLCLLGQWAFLSHLRPILVVQGSTTACLLITSKQIGGSICLRMNIE
jgi:hypothetical protein